VVPYEEDRTWVGYTVTGVLGLFDYKQWLNIREKSIY